MSKLLSILASQKKEDNECFYFYGLYSNNTQIKYVVNGSLTVDLKYSTDKETWTQWDANTFVTLYKNTKLYIKGSNTSLGTNASNYTNFVSNVQSSVGQIGIGGNINSLLDNGDGSTISTIPNYCFYKLFNDLLPLYKAEELKLSAINVGAFGYAFMFQHSGITDTITISALAVGERACYRMFYNTPYLVTAPELPATDLSNYCYFEMFRYSGVKNPPSVLPATTLKNSCYSAMFRESSLNSAPEIKGTTLASGCFATMFYSCPYLKMIKIHFTGEFGNYGTWYPFNNWVNSVSATGDFYYNGSDTSNFGTNAIPVGWTVHTF